ncbi:MAG: hypothetical protein GX628_09345 [Clostridiales bacterium]|nr:hypothetical protein [Clostridiales bacterium]
MKNIHRTLPYGLRLLNAAALDVADAMSCDATRDRETGQIRATVRVYGNDSLVAFDITAVDEEHSKFCITMLEPSPKLSDGGQRRTLIHLADSIEQLLESSRL